MRSNKSIFATLIVLFTAAISAVVTPAFGKNFENKIYPEIVAIVNDDLITSFDFVNRKKTVQAINNIQIKNEIEEKSLEKSILQGLINEKLIEQYAEEHKIEVKDKDIESAIGVIEENNKYKKGYFFDILKKKSVTLESFKAQIKSEIIKQEILSGVARSVKISQNEIDNLVISSNEKDLLISAKMFISKESSPRYLKNIQDLRKKLKSCDSIKPSLYKGFAEMVDVDSTLSRLDPQLQAILKELKANKVSSVFERSGGYAVALVCKRSIEKFTEEENSYVLNLLANKKITQKSVKFLEDMRKRATIKILLNN